MPFRGVGRSPWRSVTGRETLRKVWVTPSEAGNVSEGPPRYQGRVGRPSRRSGKVWRHSKRFRTGLETLPEVWDKLGGPPGGPGRVKRPSRRFGRPYRRSRTGWEAFPEVLEA